MQEEWGILFSCDLNVKLFPHICPSEGVIWRRKKKMHARDEKREDLMKNNEALGDGVLRGGMSR